MDMNTERFTAIKTKVNNIKLENAAAKGKIESIEEHWQNTYGFTKLEDAKKKLSEMKKETEEKIKVRDGYVEELTNLMDWEKI